MSEKTTARYMVLVSVCIMIFALVFVQVQAREATFTAVVPSSHEIDINVTGMGKVVVDGTSYVEHACIEVCRNTSLKISVIPAEGNEINSLLWNGRNITDFVSDNGEWMTSEIVEDVELVAVFTSMDENPQTKDSICIVLMGALVSLAGIGAGLRALKLKNR